MLGPSTDCLLWHRNPIQEYAQDLRELAGSGGQAYSLVNDRRPNDAALEYPAPKSEEHNLDGTMDSCGKRRSLAAVALGPNP